MTRHYAKGQILLFQGDPVRFLYYLKYGAVKVYSISDGGDENILAIRSAPDTFPLSLLLGRPNSEFFYQAITDIEVETTDPADINVNTIMRQAIELFYEALHRIAALEAKSVAERAEAARQYLLSHGIDKPTHQMIANASRSTRESVSQNLNGKRKKKK